MTYRANFEQIVSEVANQPESWIHRADDLIDGAVLLLRASRSGLLNLPAEGATNEQFEDASRSLGRRLQSLMLFAFAVECLCKAYYLRQGNGNAMYDRGKLKWLPNVTDAHHLVQIATATGVTAFLSADQLHVLEKLTVMTEIGRYPTPAKTGRYYHDEATGAHPSQVMRSVWMATNDGMVKSAIEALYEALGEPAPRGLDALSGRW